MSYQLSSTPSTPSSPSTFFREIIDKENERHKDHVHGHTHDNNVKSPNTKHNNGKTCTISRKSESISPSSYFHSIIDVENKRHEKERKDARHTWHNNHKVDWREITRNVVKNNEQ